MATNLSRVRLLIDDRGTPPIFTDAEINDFLTLRETGVSDTDYEQVLLTAADFCRARAVILSSGKEGMSVSIGGTLTYDKRSQARRFIEMAEKYEEVAKSLPQFDFAEVNATGFQAVDIFIRSILGGC